MEDYRGRQDGRGAGDPLLGYLSLCLLLLVVVVAVLLLCWLYILTWHNTFCKVYDRAREDFNSKFRMLAEDEFESDGVGDMGVGAGGGAEDAELEQKQKQKQKQKRKRRLVVVTEDSLRLGCASILKVCRQDAEEAVEELQAQKLPKAAAAKLELQSHAQEQLNVVVERMQARAKELL